MNPVFFSVGFVPVNVVPVQVVPVQVVPMYAEPQYPVYEAPSLPPPPPTPDYVQMYRDRMDEFERERLEREQLDVQRKQLEVIGAMQIQAELDRKLDAYMASRALENSLDPSWGMHPNM